MSNEKLSAKEFRIQQRELRKERVSYISEIDAIIKNYGEALQAVKYKFSPKDRESVAPEVSSVQDRMYVVLKHGIQTKAYQEYLDMLKNNLPDCEYPDMEDLFSDIES